MNSKLVEDIASAILYEGYLLYPYRASAIKNKQRWNFGVLYPRQYAEKQSGADAWTMQTECLAIADPTATLEVRMRYLKLTSERAVERQLDLPPVELAKITAQPARLSSCGTGGYRSGQRCIPYPGGHFQYQRSCRVDKRRRFAAFPSLDAHHLKSARRRVRFAAGASRSLARSRLGVPKRGS